MPINHAALVKRAQKHLHANSREELAILIGLKSRQSISEAIRNKSPRLVGALVEACYDADMNWLLRGEENVEIYRLQGEIRALKEVVSEFRKPQRAEEGNRRSRQA